MIKLICSEQGWCDSADPRKRQYEIKRGENEHMKK